jgi:Ca-activated chloride channel family protein
MSLDALFAWPIVLLLAVVAPPVLWSILRSRDARRHARLVAVTGPRHAALAAELGRHRRTFRRVLFCTGLAAGLVAVAQPRWGRHSILSRPGSVDILICLDVSRSMLARDLDPSRLVSAQRAIRALTEHARGDRFGLVAFAGEARLVVPLTRDGDSFADLADVADPLSVQRGGTDLGAALDAALHAFDDRSGEHEVVLLLTDGEDNEQRGQRAAQRCAERNITVHCVGFGSARGSKITVDGERGEEFLRAPSGSDVISTLDVAALAAIANATGGTFVDASVRPTPLLDLYEERILPKARAVAAGGEVETREPRFQWPLLVALFCWLLEFCVSERRSAPRRVR